MEKRLSKQCNKVLAYIKEHGSITQAETWTLRIQRLGARIFDLKAKGYPIETKIIIDRDENGDLMKYARYYLSEEVERMKEKYIVDIDKLELFIMQRMILPDPHLEDKCQNHVSDEYVRGINDAITAIKFAGTELKEDGGR